MKFDWIQGGILTPKSSWYWREERLKINFY